MEKLYIAVFKYKPLSYLLKKVYEKRYSIDMRYEKYLTLLCVQSKILFFSNRSLFFYINV